MNNKTVYVKIPGSTANLGPGFDSLGMALSIYAWLKMSFSDHTEIILHGEGMKGLPADESNLVFRVAQMVFAKAGLQPQPLKIEMMSDIPLTRGLGSSASAIVGALVAANAMLEKPFTKDELFQWATELEGHPDNVGASIYGGIVVASWDGSAAKAISLTPPEQLETLVVIPNFQLSTEKARHALPESYSKKDAIFNIGYSSLLVAALATGKLDVISTAMKDVIHQPYRAALIPGMVTILDQAVAQGALGAALSGAGPTLIAFVQSDSTNKESLEQFMLQTIKAEGIQAETLWLKPDVLGCEVVKISSKDDSSLLDVSKGAM